MMNERPFIPAKRGSELFQKEEVRKGIVEGTQLDVPFLIMNSLATVVAAYGLLANSTAVVIGAMLIATLLGPIMGLALAIVDGDVLLLRRAITAEVVGAFTVIFIGAVLGRIHHDLPITAEILSRTKPNLLDLMIALGGGAAGAYATVSPRLSVGLVGVAISTALVPPLTACGICFSRGLYHQAVGALILFATNLVAIQCASSLVLVAFGFHLLMRREASKATFFKRLAVDGVLLVGLSVFLYIQLVSTIGQQEFEKRVKDGLLRGLTQIRGAHLTDIGFRSTKSADVVVAVVQVPNSVTPQQTTLLQALLPTRDGKAVELHVRSLLTKESTVNGYEYELDPATPSSPQVENPTVAPPAAMPPPADPSSSGPATPSPADGTSAAPNAAPPVAKRKASGIRERGPSDASRTTGPAPVVTPPAGQS